jgi:hypothetical protein
MTFSAGQLGSSYLRLRGTLDTKLPLGNRSGKFLHLGLPIDSLFKRISYL